jgi:hypothetical protein
MKQSASREWFAIRTKLQPKQVAKLYYERQGYVVYLPIMRTIVRHARRIMEKLKSFFPGYLFLHLALLEKNWAAISSTRALLSDTVRERRVFWGKGEEVFTLMARSWDFFILMNRPGITFWELDMVKAL